MIIPLTDEDFENFPALKEAVERRLRLQVREYDIIWNQIYIDVLIEGSGTPPLSEILGLLSQPYVVARRRWGKSLLGAIYAEEKIKRMAQEGLGSYRRSKSSRKEQDARTSVANSRKSGNPFGRDRCSKHRRGKGRN